MHFRTRILVRLLVATATAVVVALMFFDGASSSAYPVFYYMASGAIALLAALLLIKVLLYSLLNAALVDETVRLAERLHRRRLLDSYIVMEGFIGKLTRNPRGNFVLKMTAQDGVEYRTYLINDSGITGLLGGVDAPAFPVGYSEARKLRTALSVPLEQMHADERARQFV